MRRTLFSFSAFTILIMLTIAVSGQQTTPVMAQDGIEMRGVELGGPCSLLSQQVPRSPDCDEEVMRYPLLELERPVEYVEERDGEAVPRSIMIPEEELSYPIAWQKRAWYFSDAPGVRPADDDWTTARLIGKYTMFHIYAAVEVGGDYWYMIGMGQWMQDEYVSVLQIPERPEPVSGPWIALDLQQQTLVAFEDDRPVYATLISAGYWLDTVEGLFQVYGRTLSMEMKGPPGANPPEYQFNTRWAMFFNEHEAIHSADFHNYFGINRTHGCVNLAPGDAEWVWNFFEQNVEEWHPSQTTFRVDNPEAAPWVYVYQSNEAITIPAW
jgi:hypothetical protein